MSRNWRSTHFAQRFIYLLIAVVLLYLVQRHFQSKVVHPAVYWLGGASWMCWQAWRDGSFLSPRRKESIDRQLAATMGFLAGGSAAVLGQVATFVLVPVPEKSVEQILGILGPALFAVSICVAVIFVWEGNEEVEPGERERH